jgi:predicted phosphodiesterase
MPRCGRSSSDRHDCCLTPLPSLSPTWRRRVRLLVFGGAGALLGVALGARVGVEVGPFDCTATAHPSLRSSTTLQIAPLGSIELDTHAAPVAVVLRVDELRPEEAERFATQPELLEGLGDELADDARRALETLAATAVLASVAGGAIGALAARVDWRSAIVGGGIGILIAGSIGSAAALTFRPEAVAEPRYTGLLTIAPRAVGDVEALIRRFDDYRAQLTDLVANVTELYRAAESLPTFDPGDDAVRVLHVSDIHLNPQAFDLANQVVDQFEVDAVVDTGDITDWGTEPESQLVNRIAELEVPYVYVRGNHDSRQTQAAVAAQPNAVVLDGQAAEVAGLRVWGIGDPRYTPDKAESDSESEIAVISEYAEVVEDRLEEAEPPAVDVVAVHDERAARLVGDETPLVLAGHRHRARADTIDDALLLVEGSTGGAGLRGLQGEEPEPLTCTVLYFDADTRRLVAYDRITLEGFGQTGVSIDRHVVQDGLDGGREAEPDGG